MKNPKATIVAIGVMLLLAACKKDPEVGIEQFRIVGEELSVGTSSATLTGTYDCPIAIKGLAACVTEGGNAVGEYAAELNGKAFSIGMTGLRPSTTYTYYYKVDYGATEPYVTESKTFTTLDVAVLDEMPMARTLEVLAIDSTTCRVKCEVVSEGGSPVTEQGICWNTTGNPSVADATLQCDSTGLGTYTVYMERLSPGKQYYVRAYARNAMGVGLGNVMNFEMSALPGMPVDIHVSCMPEDGGVAIGGGTYEAGTTCTVVAGAAAGYTFVNWTENGNQVSAETSYTFPVTVERNLVANFSADAYIISVGIVPEEGGTATGAGGYAYGDTCTLVTTPNMGYDFVKWTRGGNTVSTEAEYSFAVKESATYTAHFQVKSYSIAVAANPAEGGSVSGGGSLHYGESCTVHAVPAEGYAFANWIDEGDVVSTEADYTFTVTGNRSLKANFTELQPNEYTINVSANPTEGGTVTGGGTYNVGASCTLTATPASGYQFQSWKRNGVVMSTNPTYTFTVTESATYTAYFGEIPINYYTITTAVNPEGAGSVTGGGTYQEGSSITLTAISNAGYMFNHWNDGNTSNPRTVTVTQNATYTAYYDLEEYTIQVYASPAEGGAVTGGGNYHYGETATLTATPAYGYEFAGWSDGVNDNPREVTVTCAAYYVAVFSELGTTYYTVTTNVDPEGAGTVTGGGVYPEATVTALAAEANPGYVFDHWSDGVVANPRVITVNDNMSFTAYFNQNTYNVTVNANPANGGSVSGGGTYVYGDVAVLRATPYNGYDFVGWSDGSNENPHYVTVTGNATYTATFSQAGATYYTVSAYVSPTDAGYVTGSGTYPEGASVTLEAMVYPGYSFSQWNDGVTQNPRAVTVNNNMSFTAYFNIEQYNITVNANPAVGGTVTGGGTYAYGETAVLTATPNMDYSFMQWGDGVMDNPRLVTVTGNATYTALFLTVGGEVYTLTVTSSNPFLGSVFGGGVYPAGSAVDISAFPSLQGRFVKWQDGNTENPRTVILNGDMEFTAEFTAKQQYTIVVNSANPTMGEAFGGGTYNEGDEIGLLAVANEGYRFTQWNDGVTEEYRMVTVTGDATYTAYFVANSVVTHTLTLICNTDEGSVSGGGVYVEGSTATVQAFPNEGFEFDFWNDGNRENPRTVTVNDDLVMIAYFKSTSVDESDMAKLSVYPNPAKERIRIEGLENTCEVVIYNSLGEMVKTANVNSENEIGIQDLASGVYVVRCGNRALRFVKM